MGPLSTFCDDPRIRMACGLAKGSSTINYVRLFDHELYMPRTGLLDNSRFATLHDTCMVYFRQQDTWPTFWPSQLGFVHHHCSCGHHSTFAHDMYCRHLSFNSKSTDRLHIVSCTIDTTIIRACYLLRSCPGQAQAAEMPSIGFFDFDFPRSTTVHGTACLCKFRLS